MIQKKIGKHIQKAREEAGLSQEELASLMGCTQAALSNYELGKRRLYLANLAQLARILHKPINYFLEEPEEYLNHASFWPSSWEPESLTPVFETPELPEKTRLELFKYLTKVRRQVHRDYVLRTLRRNPIMGILLRNQTIGRLTGYLVINRYIERFFYQSIFIRRLLESFRYRLSSGNRAHKGYGS